MFEGFLKNYCEQYKVVEDWDIHLFQGVILLYDFMRCLRFAWSPSNNQGIKNPEVNCYVLWGLPKQSAFQGLKSLFVWENCRLNLGCEVFGGPLNLAM